MPATNSLQNELKNLKEELAKVEVEVAVQKIELNGSYGKFGSKWSILYSPDLLIHTTMTGQLTLLLLIEELENAGIKVVSANTDGIVVHHPKELNDTKNKIISEFEKLTNLVTEETPYRAIHNRDVNTYINVKADGKTKTKGAYALEGLAKNPHGDISTIAVIEYLTHGTEIIDTIRNCKDIRKFLFARKVTTGASKNDIPLGKVVRWYYAVNETTPITYTKNGNKVSESDGGKPLMTLPDTFPDDVDYQRYVDISMKTLKLIGV